VNHTFRRASEVVSATLFLMLAGTTAAFAGPAPIEPEFPPPAVDPQPVSSDGFPWMLSSIAVLLTVSALAVIAVLWQRTRSGHHGLVTP
jgi:hypothetical protein